jgi:hypothetical protein
MDDYIKIFSGSFIIVQLVLDRLQGAGINAIVKDDSESGRLAGFGSAIQNFQELYVSKDEVELAIPIVEEVNAELQQ